MNRYYAGVAERAGHRCEYCHVPEAIFNLPFEVELIVPTSRDGPDDESNQALACRACNQAASHRQQQQLRDGRSEVGSIVLTPWNLSFSVHWCCANEQRIIADSTHPMSSRPLSPPENDSRPLIRPTANPIGSG